MNIKIVECPRDAMQGLSYQVPTQTKIDYINRLLRVGFDTIDFGSFVSPKVIPQMSDTEMVYEGLISDTSTKLSAIVANFRGAEKACEFERIDFLGFPFSVSETFQLRNTNSTIEESEKRVDDIVNLCVKHNKKLVIYLSMAFGNPYGDEWNVDLVCEWTKRMVDKGIEIISLSDTIGSSTPESITQLMKGVIPAFPDTLIGAHIHTSPDTWKEKMEAAYLNGCRRFDGAIKGYGGCPMAKDELIGNMPTENMLIYFKDQNLTTGVDDEKFMDAMFFANEVFKEEH